MILISSSLCSLEASEDSIISGEAKHDGPLFCGVFETWQISLNWQYFVILASVPKLWHFHSLDQAVQILYLS